MGPSDIVLAPWRAGKFVARLAEDVHDLAERARRDPDPVEQARERIDALLVGVRELTAVARALTATAATLDRTATGLDGTAGSLDGGGRELLEEVRGLLLVAADLVTGGSDLKETADTLDGHAAELVTGGSDLKETADTLDGHAAELVVGGQDLTATAKQMNAALQAFRAALPKLMAGLDTVEELEDAVGTVAETVEPLQGVASGVGRVSRALGRSKSSDGDGDGDGAGGSTRA